MAVREFGEVSESVSTGGAKLTKEQATAGIVKAYKEKATLAAVNVGKAKAILQKKGNPVYDAYVALDAAFDAERKKLPADVKKLRPCLRTVFAETKAGTLSGSFAIYFGNLDGPCNAALLAADGVLTDEEIDGAKVKGKNGKNGK